MHGRVAVSWGVSREAETMPQFVACVGTMGPWVAELCASMSLLWQACRSIWTCATNGVLGSSHGMLYPKQAENMPELIQWMGLWVFQAEPGQDEAPWSVPRNYMVSSPGDQSDHKLALRNIASMVRPGGVLVIDHRNYDHILATGCAPPGKNIYYKVGG